MTATAHGTRHCRHCTTLAHRVWRGKPEGLHTHGTLLVYRPCRSPAMLGPVSSMLLSRYTSLSTVFLPPMSPCLGSQ